MKNALFAAAFSALIAPQAEAAAVYLFEEIGAGVAGTLSGTLDLTGAPAQPGFLATSTGGSISTGLGQVVAQNFFDEQTVYTVQGPANFGIGASVDAASFSGVSLFLDGASELRLASSYVSGTPLSGELFFAGETFSTLGVFMGLDEVVYTLPSDTLTLRFGEATQMPVVPLPASLLLLANALGFLALAGRRFIVCDGVDAPPAVSMCQGSGS